MLKTKYLLLTLSILCCFSNVIIAQVNSVLSEGQWVKIGINEDNIYKISYTDIQSLGFNPSDIDPMTIQLFGNGAGMLPQANSVSRPLDLLEVSVYIHGENDGSFDPDDFILFWGEGPDMLFYDSENNEFEYQNHLFTDSNYYFLTFNNNPGKRIVAVPPELSGTIYSSAFKVYIHENDQHNILHSGRQWFGEAFDLETIQSFDTGINNISPSSDIKIFSSVMSTSTHNSTFFVKMNGIDVGSHLINANPFGTYAQKGTIDSKSFTINQNRVGNDPVTLTYQFTKESGIGYLDYFKIEYQIDLQYSNEPLDFFTGNINKDDNITFSISKCPDDLILWNISDQNNVVEVQYEQTGDVITFNSPTAANRYLLFSPISSLSTPGEFQIVENQDLHGISNTDLLIVSSETFANQATTIAELRTAEGLSVILASPGQVYNEFSSGKTDITAIRDFVKYLYDNAGLQYLLIFGKGTYDPRNILGTNLSLIPIYESRNSLHPLGTYSSDDYLGFLEDSEGEWDENSSGDHTLDIGVGRIPVIDENEANNFINKLSNYKSKESIGQWRTDVVFVAENGDFNIHQRDAERLSTLVDTTYATFNTNKIYIDAYPIESLPGRIIAPDANEALYSAINSGTLITNFTGHGNENQWANTKIFDKKVIDSLANHNHLSLFVTATCEFGRHDDTGSRSGGEELIIKDLTGAIGLITTARPVFSSSNYQLNRAFYQSVFSKENGDYQRIGDIFKATKNNSLNGVLNRNFSLLADPSMKLAYPSKFITLDSLNGYPIISSDTLSSLKSLEFTGFIRDSEQKVVNNYNGVVRVKIYGKLQTKQTLGNLGSIPFRYNIRDNILFDGKATIIDGKFRFTTVLPKDLSYNPSSTKISLYAQSEDSLVDASGANIDLLLGKTDSNPLVDNIPPEIGLFIGDTNYVEGRVVNSHSLLIAKLSDKNGINTSRSQVGHSITYSLDGNEPIELNDYFTTTLDDFTNGWIYYDLPKLSPGEHIIELTAWDTSNNPSTATIEFKVAFEEQIVLTDLSNYPNPMRENTTFTVAHNLTGKKIDVTLQIMSTSGQIMFEEIRSYESAPSIINDWYWNGRNSSGGKLNEGLYIYGINIRSYSSNISQSRYSRLFVTN